MRCRGERGRGIHKAGVGEAVRVGTEQRPCRAGFGGEELAWRVMLLESGCSEGVRMLTWWQSVNDDTS